MRLDDQSLYLINPASLLLHYLRRIVQTEMVILDVKFQAVIYGSGIGKNLVAKNKTLWINCDVMLVFITQLSSK